MRTVYFSMPMKMRRNLKVVLFLSISWMFLMFYYFQSGNPKNENRALRLRETATAAQYLDETSASTSPAHSGVQLGFLIGDTSPRLTFDYFDEAGYIQRGGLRTGEDPYQRNRFNQQASDQLPSNRVIPDTRNQMCRRKVYRKDLPPTSVIITFHNEARSTLLRTIVRNQDKFTLPKKKKIESNSDESRHEVKCELSEHFLNT